MTTQRPTLRIHRHFDASAERVFDAWLDPATAGRWLFATPNGTMLRVEIDARVGGTFCIVRRDGDDVEHVGTYEVIDRPRRLVFTFGVPKFSDEPTRVTVDIVGTGSGCDLTLTHENVAPDWTERTREGWTGIVTGLAQSLAA